MTSSPDPWAAPAKYRQQDQGPGERRPLSCDCPICGAVMADPVRHREWHQKRDAFVRAVLQAATDCLTVASDADTPLSVAAGARSRAGFLLGLLPAPDDVGPVGL